MKITDLQKLGDIQLAFQAQFPYLKLEFYKNSHLVGEGSTRNDVLDHNLSVFDVTGENVVEEISVTGDMTVALLESQFAATFGLGLQVFRKSGQIWLQTTTTDHLTLDEQNQKAIVWLNEDDGMEDIPDAMDRLELE